MAISSHCERVVDEDPVQGAPASPKESYPCSTLYQRYATTQAGSELCDSRWGKGQMPDRRSSSQHSNGGDASNSSYLQGKDQAGPQKVEGQDRGLRHQEREPLVQQGNDARVI